MKTITVSTNLLTDLKILGVLNKLKEELFYKDMVLEALSYSNNQTLDTLIMYPDTIYGFNFWFDIHGELYQMRVNYETVKSIIEN